MNFQFGFYSNLQIFSLIFLKLFNILKVLTAASTFSHAFKGYCYRHNKQRVNIIQNKKRITEKYV